MALLESDSEKRVHWVIKVKSDPSIRVKDDSLIKGSKQTVIKEYNIATFRTK